MTGGCRISEATMTDAPANTVAEVEVARGFLVATANLVSGLTFQVVIPLVSLLAMVVMFIWVLSRAQKSDDFDASQFLRDEFGKLSAWRLFAFVCVSTHTWVIFSQQINDKLTENGILIYCATWSSSAVLAQVVSAWQSKGSQYQPPRAPNPAEPGGQP
jgi:hypothetical protein